MKFVKRVFIGSGIFCVMLILLNMAFAACSCGNAEVIVTYSTNGSSNPCTHISYNTYTCGNGHVINVVQKGPLGHNFGTGTCISKGTCTRCGYAGGSYGSHSYTGSCLQPHCSASICSLCGAHRGACGGGHVSTKCSHCGTSYCSKCNNHTPKVSCPCNNSRSCSNPHCRGITWCSYCGRHSHVGCNRNSICTLPHCGKSMCSVCGSHTCTGGHKYIWVTNDTGETQTHIYQCSVSGCTATNGTHSANWGSGNASHTSTCKQCNLTYTHEAVWSTAQRSATEPHPCAWWGGCSATHTAIWGEYYKTNGGKDGDSDGGPHTRKCSTCGILEIYHNYSDEAWSWTETENHTRVCKTCGLKQTLGHNFTKYEAKEENSNHDELYKHWKICTTCDPNHKEVDELHEDNGSGICSKCTQVLWKIITDSGENITKETLNEENAEGAFRDAKREEKIKIIEVIDDNGSPKLEYIHIITGADDLEADSNNEITITKNGTYSFTTGRGGTASFVIDNISREILIDKILTPMTSTTGEVVITVRANKAEEKFNKKIFIKEGRKEEVSISDAELSTGSNNFFVKKENITKNGIYYFIARDTAGNEREIVVLVDNIIKGQATVAISYDVFKNGYVFTEILVNPDAKWSKEGNTSDIVKAKVYKIGSTKGTALGDENIKIVKVMDMQRKDVEGDSYLPGAYYIRVAVGGSIFSEKGTYIIDLENVNLPSVTETISLEGKNRIIVEVQDLKDLT